ncbi:hypothetical protein B484DRAFT_395910 [Ochromonadaceae sp. CCMP2298]|nr:hypothetical protein B484DRAFT_395910 [Ochromonadaceae sp. CCMP2298]
MDSLIRELLSSDTKTRLIAVERVAAKLQQGPLYRELQTDTKLKLLSATVATVRDANPKVVAAGLSSMHGLLRRHSADFQPLNNLSFEVLLNKMGDSKPHIRAQALEVC